jgi:hypothetical protein
VTLPFCLSFLAYFAVTLYLFMSLLRISLALTLATGCLCRRLLQHHPWCVHDALAHVGPYDVARQMLQGQSDFGFFCWRPTSCLRSCTAIIASAPRLPAPQKRCKVLSYAALAYSRVCMYEGH